MGAEVDLTTREGSRDHFHGRAGLSGTAPSSLAKGRLPEVKDRGWRLSGGGYLDYLIKRIEPDAGFAFGFVDAQVKVAYDLTPQHQVAITTLMGRAVFEEGDPDIGENDIQDGINTAWLTSLSWRYIPSPRFAITQRLFSTGVDFDNDIVRRHGLRRALPRFQVAR